MHNPILTLLFIQVMDRASANGYNYDEPGCRQKSLMHTCVSKGSKLIIKPFSARGKLRSRRTRSRTYSRSIRETKNYRPTSNGRCCEWVSYRSIWPRSINSWFAKISAWLGFIRYGPTTGIKELRHAVANLYNETYRQGKDSKYTYENVCIVPGGRAGLIRIAAIIGVSGNRRVSGWQIAKYTIIFNDCRTYTLRIKFQVGKILVFQTVDIEYHLTSVFGTAEYTAYSSMLAAFRRLLPVPTSLSSGDKYKLHVPELDNTIKSVFKQAQIFDWLLQLNCKDL